MPGRDEKTEYGGAFLSQMRNKARSLYEQAFAEIYIEDGQPSNKAGIEPQPILQRTPGGGRKTPDLFRNAPHVLLRWAVRRILYPAAVRLFLRTSQVHGKI